MSAKRFSIDSNLLIYAVDFRDPAKQSAAEYIVRTAVTRDCLLGLQCIGEFYAATTRKKILPRHDANREASNFLTIFSTFQTTGRAHVVALREVATTSRFSYWDTVLLASADEAGCTTILSEDMADGARLGNITVRNPFGPAGLSAAAAAALAP